MPSSSGLWTPWFPFTLPTFWPFSWHIAIVLDHFSRKLLAIEVFPQEPSANQMLRFFDTALAVAGNTPKYIMTDRGTQFRSEYLDWCAGHGIRPRFGALGKKGAIAIAERFVLSLKDEALRRIIGPMSMDAMRRQLVAYATWYNQHRPHQSLSGRTPAEVCFALRPARDGPRFETREACKIAPDVELRSGPLPAGLRKSERWIGPQRDPPPPVTGSGSSASDFKCGACWVRGAWAWCSRRTTTCSVEALR